MQRAIDKIEMERAKLRLQLVFTSFDCSSSSESSILTPSPPSPPEEVSLVA